MTIDLKVYSAEEIDLLLNGDRREVDKLLIHGINNIATVLIPHTIREEALMDAIGSIEVVRVRSAWIEAQIRRQEKRNAMMQKVSESAMAWALIAFLGFITYAAWDAVVEAVRSHKVK